jgi:nicotinamide-nucleotide amidase
VTCAVLCIGTELTRGELVNSNAAWLSSRLVELGFEVTENAVVDDDAARIVSTFTRLCAEHDVIVATGGLGPTTDDLTTAAIAKAVGKSLVRDEESFEQIRRRFERLGRTMAESNAKQADFPEGATVLANPIGTAPGFGVTFGKARAFFMPGVPREMQRMFDEEIVPKISALAPNEHHQVRLRTFGLPESVVGERLAGIEAANPGIIIGYRAHFPEIEVKVLARGVSGPSARELCDKVAEEVKTRLADVVYGEDEESFASALGKKLRRKGKTLAVAESCTGGLVASLLTKEPGASEFLLLGVVTYANSAKTQVLGVDEEIIRAHGAVSGEVAAAMAEGARRASGADIALSITGIAGPSGGSDDKPVGTVWFGISSARGTDVKLRNFPPIYDRTQIQTLAAYAGMALVRDLAREL